METKQDKLEELELRSEEVSDLLQKPPHWMIRWGNLVLITFIFFAILLSCILHYPDYVQSGILITSVTPPVKIESRVNSKIESVFVKDQQSVKKGDLLAVLQSTADYSDVLTLKQLIDSSENRSLVGFPLRTSGALRLGDIQEDYNAFAKAIEQEDLFYTLKPYNAETITADQNITDYQARISNLRQQQLLEKDKLELATNNFKRFRLLFEQKVISTSEFESEKIKLLEEQRNYKNIQISISQLEEAILGFKKMKSGVSVSNEKDRISYSSSSQQLLERLRKAIRQWEQNYLMTASIDGVVSFQKFLNENKIVNNGDVLLSIIPFEKGGLIGQMFIGAQNLGKVKEQQNVLIKLDNFRYQEYGMVKGKVNTISLVADSDNKFYVEVGLPDELATSYNKKLSFDKELRGSADIVTEDATLAQRILYSIRSLVNFNKQ